MPTMTKEKRHSKRIIIRLLAEFFSAGKDYVGAIENLSEYGICIRIFPLNSAIDFVPGTPIELEFKCLSGEKLNLRCEVKWIFMYKEQTRGLITNMGMEIIDSPQKYKESIRNLS